VLTIGLTAQTQRVSSDGMASATASRPVFRTGSG
jgi:hypothetical protein